MNNLQKADESGLKNAIESIEKNDFGSARNSLGLNDTLDDNEVFEALIELFNAIKLFKNQKHLESVEHFKKALPIINTSNNKEAKYIIKMMHQFAEGLCALFNGDAHQASRLLNITSEAIDRICIFMPGFKIASFSYKAASLIALGRSYLNAAQINLAEETFSKAQQCHDELLTILNPNLHEHAMAFAEVYGTRLEYSFLFIMMVDLPTLDIKTWKKRLESTKKDMEELSKYVVTVPKGPIQILMSQYPIIFSILDTFQRSLEISTIKRRPFKKNEIEELVKSESELFSVRRSVLGCGERNRGILIQIDQLRALQRNLIQLGNASTKDFGRFNGFVSLFSMTLLLVILSLTVNIEGFFGILYFLGALILSLIVGFGYGALKFQPLIKIFTEAIQKESSEEN